MSRLASSIDLAPPQAPAIEACYSNALLPSAWENPEGWRQSIIAGEPAQFREMVNLVEHLVKGAAGPAAEALIDRGIEAALDCVAFGQAPRGLPFVTFLQYTIVDVIRSETTRRFQPTPPFR